MNARPIVVNGVSIHPHWFTSVVPEFWQAIAARAAQEHRARQRHKAKAALKPAATAA